MLYKHTSTATVNYQYFIVNHINIIIKSNIIDTYMLINFNKMSIVNVFGSIIVLIIICDAKIKINVTISDKGDIAVLHQGSDVKRITSKEINLFNITDQNLKKGLRVELGKEPNDVFLQDPTPYHNVFEKYRWPEVKRNLKIANITVSGTVNEKINLKIGEYINNSTSAIVSDVNISKIMENLMFSTFSAEGLPDDEIYYDVNIKFNKQNFSYENKWRDNSLKSVLLPVGVQRDGHFQINPGQTIVAKLTAQKTIILVKVKYSANLFGCVFANYERLYGKYHFWAPTIMNVMRAGNLTNEIITTETLQIRCYTKPALKIYDKKTGKCLPIDLSFKNVQIKYKLCA